MGRRSMPSPLPSQITGWKLEVLGAGSRSRWRPAASASPSAGRQPRRAQAHPGPQAPRALGGAGAPARIWRRRPAWAIRWAASNSRARPPRMEARPHGGPVVGNGERGRDRERQREREKQRERERRGGEGEREGGRMREIGAGSNEGKASERGREDLGEERGSRVGGCHCPIPDLHSRSPSPKHLQ